MRFTVTWLPEAERRLAQLWNDAMDRRAITSASNRIDALLRDDPLKSTTSVDGYHFLSADPLTVLCEVSVPDRMVRVVEVHSSE